MTRIKTLQDLFKRYRRPGDLVFALLFLAFAVFLLANLDGQTQWVKRTKTVAQPAFWPTVAVYFMAGFAILHLIGSLVSPRIEGRWIEVKFWLRSFEFAIWFMIYVALVPRIGYLPASVLFPAALAFRLGYRLPRQILTAAAAGVTIVVLFKSLLQVKVPGGAIYEYLPDTLRAFMLTYF
ncbi:MAG: tripartite tricarboxylate transporter TctB family protein [Rhizobiaceae bacterium]